MAHRVLVTTPGAEELRKQAVVLFQVIRDGEKFGELQVGRYGVAWKPRGKQRSKWTGWSDVQRRLFGT